MLKTHTLGLFSAAVLIASALVSNGVSAQSATATPAASVGTAYVRIVHASPDAPAVDVYADAAVLSPNVKFGDATEFVPVAPGDYTLAIRPAGAAATTKAVAAVDVHLVDGIAANVLAIGYLNGTGTQALKLVVITSDRSPTVGKARLEIIHAAPKAPTVDILGNGQPKLTEIKYGKPGASPLNFDPGTYNLAVVATGSTTPALIDLPNTALKADTIYTVIATTIKTALQSRSY